MNSPIAYSPSRKPNPVAIENGGQSSRLDRTCRYSPNPHKRRVSFQALTAEGRLIDAT
jgi:hypothetical protein